MTDLRKQILAVEEELKAVDNDIDYVHDVICLKLRTIADEVKDATCTCGACGALSAEDAQTASNKVAQAVDLRLPGNEEIEALREYAKRRRDG